jgi:hypothetical protein
MIKRKILVKILILIVFVFSFTSTVMIGYSYFDNISSSVQETITIGDWEQDIEWNSNISYSRGDIITFNGSTYQARYNVPAGLSPSSFLGWLFWVRI